MEQSRLIPFAPSVKCEQASIEWQRAPVKRIPRTNFHKARLALSAFAFGMMTLCRQASAKSTAKGSAPPQPKERHPEIRDAMQLRNQAQDHLTQAAHDFGGHRVKAVKHISEALEELHAAQQFGKH